MKCHNILYIIFCLKICLVAIVILTYTDVKFIWYMFHLFFISIPLCLYIWSASLADNIYLGFVLYPVWQSVPYVAYTDMTRFICLPSCYKFSIHFFSLCFLSVYFWGIIFFSITFIFLSKFIKGLHFDSYFTLIEWISEWVY